jgi:hypothetical protein
MSPRTTATPAAAPCSEAATQLIVIERDDGLWSIGWHDDAAGPFESRKHAVDVAAREAEVRDHAAA